MSYYSRIPNDIRIQVQSLTGTLDSQPRSQVWEEEKVVLGKPSLETECILCT